ncbi:MAG: flagellar hook-basal body complex protein [Pirellulales bacterium]
MGLQSALSTALTGMTAAETTIDVVGNNVANSNTVGFKASEAIFASQFLQTQSLGSFPTETRGGTNPRQIGLGTKVAEISPDFTQGTIEVSANPLDLAIQGDGFLIVQGGQGEQLYTRNGQLKLNADNELVTTTGQRVLGFGVDDDFQIQRTGLEAMEIPLGSAAVAQATQNVFLQGTLRPPAPGEVDSIVPGIIESAVLSDGSIEVPPNMADSDINAINPPASTTTAAVGAAGGTITVGDYTYRVTFVDADGNEGPASIEIGPVTNAGGQEIDLSNIPQADGTTFVDRNIYRANSAGSGDFEFVGSIGDATTTAFTDSVGDAGLPGGTLEQTTLDEANYTYYVTFFNTSSGLESRPTAQIGPESVTIEGRMIRLENIPQPASGGEFNAVRVYRNLASDDSSFYRIAELTGGESSHIDGAIDADIEVPGNEINLDGPTVSFGLSLLDVVRREGTTYQNVFEEGTLSFTPKKGGRSLATQELAITPTTTVQDLVNFMQQAMGIQETSPDPNFPIPGNPGGLVNADGRIEFVSNNGVDSELQVDLSAFQLTTAAGLVKSVPLGFTKTQDAVGESAVTDFVVYDSLGIPLNVRLTAVLESTDGNSTTYRWYADSPDNDPDSGAGIAVGTGVVTFDGSGSVTSVSNSTVSVDRANVSSASPLQFELDFSQTSGLDTGQSSIAASRQDGSGAGTLTSFIITESGAIRGVFSNGIARDLGQIRLARFSNNSGLEQVGDNLFASGVNSGLPVEGDPGEQGIGTISAGAVELSNTDIGQNLIELILASTQYRGGTRVITAVQQLFDELLALRR